MDAILIITQGILRFLAAIATCFLYAITRLQYFKKNKKIQPINDKVLVLSAKNIAHHIRSRQLKCEDVIQAFINRCKEVNPIINAIVEERFDAAIQDARKVDIFLKTTTKTEDELARELPLLGVPITVKESVAVKGMSNAAGVKMFAGDKAQQDAPVIAAVKKAGGIILLVSNTPEMCLFWETYNNVTGRTNNPYDTNRVPGGSSGGEAALLGAGASVISIASDIAGSGRIPALFCGVFGHKPSPGLVSCDGHRPQTTDKRWPYFFTMTPMVRYAEDIPLILKVISEPNTDVGPLNEKISMKDIRFFYLTDENSYITTPVSTDIKSAIHNLRTYLETTYEIKVEEASSLQDLKYTFNIATSTLLKMDGVETIFKTKKDTQAADNVCLELLKYMFCLSSNTFPPVAYGLAKKVSDKLPKSYHAKMAEKKDALTKQFRDLLGDNGVLIYPSFVTTAIYHNETILNCQNFTYTMLYNALGFPVTQCPMGFNNGGLPVGVQIVGLPGSDHLTIAVAQEIQKAFGGWKEPSFRTQP